MNYEFQPLHVQTKDCVALSLLSHTHNLLVICADASSVRAYVLLKLSLSRQKKEKMAVAVQSDTILT